MSNQDTDDIPSSDSDEALPWLIEHGESKNLKFTVCLENKRETLAETKAFQPHAEASRARILAEALRNQRL